MKKNKAKNKLMLERETITVLKSDALEGANGGQASVLTLLITIGVNTLACRVIC